MLKKELLDFRVRQCGGCRLQIRFWPVDGAKLTCFGCGLAHEVECDEALNLTTGERTELVMLVPVWGAKNDGRLDVSQN